jgi:hypothetical protein
MLSLGLGLPQQPQSSNFVRTYANDIADAYSDRVIADGGTVEGLACLAYKIFLLGVRNILDNVDVIAGAYVNRVTGDGGIVEGYGCLLNEVTTLSFLGTTNPASGIYYFINRWIADGATVESEVCLENSIFALNQ